jgi:radical SAM superfamily enzyme YgiQ (UPF0313 family)
MSHPRAGGDLIGKPEIMHKPSLILIHPSPDKDRLCTRRRTKSSVAQINLPLLAAYADDRFDVRIVDENVEDIDFSIRPDLIGISIMTPTALRGYEIADSFRQRGIPVVLGGMHVFFMRDEAAAHANAIVVGEAEYSWNELLNDFLAGRMNRVYTSDKYHDLAGLPTPRRDLLKPGAYSFPNVIETARGCPHKCSFCSVTTFWGNRFRFRPVEEVVDEIKTMPPGDLLFIDDNVFGHPKRAKELFEALMPLKRRWIGQGELRFSRDPELLDLATRSGCGWIFIGMESVSSANLKAMNKSGINRVEDYDHEIATIHRKGIKILGSFMFGLDDDDTGVFDRTLNFCIRNKLEAANFYILTPMPGTKLFDEMKAAHRILHYNWARYDANHVVFQPLHMTPGELLEGYIKVYKSFYSMKSITARLLGFRSHMLQLMAINMGRMKNARYFEEGCRI